MYLSVQLASLDHWGLIYSCIPSRECNVGDSALSVKDFMSLTTYTLRETDRGQQALQAWSQLEVQQIHSREGKDGKGC